MDGIKRYISEKISWSTRITILAEDGSTTLYSTPYFEELKKYILETFPSKNDIKEYAQKKDKFELDGYFKELKRFSMTKALFSHIRRKLQILNYFKTKKLIFDYRKCLSNLEISDIKRRRLEELHNLYSNREELFEEEVGNYYNLAKELTNEILVS